jgi:hypothetical protein
MRANVFAPARRQVCYKSIEISDEIVANRPRFGCDSRADTGYLGCPDLPRDAYY